MKKQCTHDQSEAINDAFAGSLGILALMQLQAHHLGCVECRVEWQDAIRLRTTLRQVAAVTPPPGLQARIGTQLPKTTASTTIMVRERQRRHRVRWAVAGIGILFLTTAGSVTAQKMIDPLRQQYAMMHEDKELAAPITPKEGSSGIRSRMDGLYGHDASMGMRWRVTGQVKVSVYDLQTGQLLVGGGTMARDTPRLDNLRSMIGPEAFSYYMGLNPVADPNVAPVLTVSMAGQMVRKTGYGRFTAFDKWQFEIAPIGDKP